MLKKRFLIPALLMVSAVVLAACAAPTPETIVVTKEVPGETIIETVEVPVEVEVQVPGETITFWSTENQPARAAKTQEIIKRFTEATGIAVELVLVGENNIDSVMAANFAAGTLPDVVFFPLDFAAGWHAEGILDAEAASAVIEALDKSTFSEGALNLVNFGGKYAAVPSDGWGQFIVYRADLFKELGLEAPTTYEKIKAAAIALEEAGFTGILAGTDPGQVFTQQNFEHFALANGVQLTDDAGNVTLNTPQMVEALAFYTELMAKYGPKDTATYWDQARALYFAGRAGMTVWSPFILDEMAGLRDSVLPNCPECEQDRAYLAKNSGFVPAFSGPSGGPAQYGQVSYMGITTGAQTEAAKQFVEFWLSDGYLDWLGVAAEGKFPMRRGTADDPEAFIKGWSQLEVGVDRKAPLSDFYSDEVLNSIIQGANNIDRWGFAQGQGELVSGLYSELIIPQAIADIIDGFLSPEEAAAEIQARVEELQAALAED
jgi:multiple sugar transport system substrate-binding protein